MNVKGASETLKEYIDLENRCAKKGITLGYMTQLMMRALKAEATIEALVRLGAFGDMPRVVRSDGTVVREQAAVDAENVPDLWTIDLERVEGENG